VLNNDIFAIKVVINREIGATKLVKAVTGDFILGVLEMIHGK